MLPMQIISSYQWDLQLGDIKSPPEAVLEVVGNVYGQNDAPCAWYCTFNDEAVQSGWLRSKLDSCLYFPLDDQSRLCGIVGVHVDDTAVGGCAPVFEKAVAKPKSRFPYRKWRTQIGEFCGTLYRQDPPTKAISMSQQTFAGSLKHASTPKGTDNGKSLNESQKRVLRVINESLNWLSSQSRPDLSVQTSMCQQGFPNPTIRNLRDANNAIRHAKQHKYLTIAFHPIPPDELSLCCHSDAVFANVGTHTHTQAGYVVAFVNKSLQEGAVATWTPVVWKSYKMGRAVSSTLAGGSQALATASGTVEWVTLMISEAVGGPFDPRSERDRLSLRRPILATDCKSLFDHVVSPSSPTAVEARRTSIDRVILRESIDTMSAWIPQIG